MRPARRATVLVDRRPFGRTAILPARFMIYPGNTVYMFADRPARGEPANRPLARRKRPDCAGRTGAEPAACPDSAACQSRRGPRAHDFDPRRASHAASCPRGAEPGAGAVERPARYRPVGWPWPPQGVADRPCGTRRSGRNRPLFPCFPAAPFGAILAGRPWLLSPFPAVKGRPIPVKPAGRLEPGVSRPGGGGRPVLARNEAAPGRPARLRRSGPVVPVSAQGLVTCKRSLRILRDRSRGWRQRLNHWAPSRVQQGKLPSGRLRPQPMARRGRKDWGPARAGESRPHRVGQRRRLWFESQLIDSTRLHTGQCRVLGLSRS